MNANRLHVGKVTQEITEGFIDNLLYERAVQNSKGIEETILAFYIILRAEELASTEKVLKRKF